MDNYIAPELEKDGFNCPHCNAYTQQVWCDVGTIVKAVTRDIKESDRNPEGSISELRSAYCTKCENYSFWFHEKMIYPTLSIAPLPFEDMPKDVKNDFNEARMIVNESPRGAAALLRLALEKLLPQVGAEGKKIDRMIGYLVKEKNLPVPVQKALDSLRVIGNEAVHPGELDLKDDTETALALFRVLNVIVHTMIIQPKEIDELYEMIPEPKKEGITNRDKKM